MPTGCVWSFVECDIRLGAYGWHIDPPGAAMEWAKANPVLSDAVARYREHLRANEIDFVAKEILGP
jgi:hypothetical protein